MNYIRTMTEKAHEALLAGASRVAQKIQIPVVALMLSSMADAAIVPFMPKDSALTNAMIAGVADTSSSYYLTGGATVSELGKAFTGNFQDTGAFNSFTGMTDAASVDDSHILLYSGSGDILKYDVTTGAQVFLAPGIESKRASAGTFGIGSLDANTAYTYRLDNGNLFATEWDLATGVVGTSYDLGKWDAAWGTPTGGDSFSLDGVVRHGITSRNSTFGNDNLLLEFSDTGHTNTGLITGDGNGILNDTHLRYNAIAGHVDVMLGYDVNPFGRVQVGSYNSTIPEPATVALFTGLVGLLYGLKRRRNSPSVTKARASEEAAKDPADPTVGG